MPKKDPHVALPLRNNVGHFLLDARQGSSPGITKKLRS